MHGETEYMTSNRLVRYPFSDGSVLPVSDAVANIVFGCFIDAMVQLKPVFEETVPAIESITLNGHTLSFTLSGNGKTALTCTRSRTRFPVIHGETDWCWYSFVLSSDGIRDLEGSLSQEDALKVENAKLELSPRCTGATPTGVLSFLVYDGLRRDSAGERMTIRDAISAGHDFEVSSDVSLIEGNNITMTSDESGISLEAGAGLGAGKIVCSGSEKEDDGRGIWSKDGHIRLFNDTCYDYSIENQTTEGAARFNAKCKACCTCEMYAGIVNGRLVPVKDSIIEARESIKKTLSKYEDAVRKWNTRLTRAEAEDIVTTMTAVPLETAGTDIDNVDVTGRMSRCGFTVTVRNDSFVNVTVTIGGISSNGTVFQDSIGYMDGLTPRIVKGAAGKSVSLQPGKSLTLSYFVRLDFYSGKSESRAFTSSVRISAYQGGRMVCSKTEVASA